MRRPVLVALTVCSALLLIGCGGQPAQGPTRPAAESSPPIPTPTITAKPTPEPTRKPKPSATPKPSSSLTPDPRNRFYTDDTTWYDSPWYVGRHRIMVDYGCTADPFYDPDPRCGDDHGFHHGVDIAMPCGTVITAGVNGRVIDPGRPGTPGPAYGKTAFRIRTAAGQDILIGHARTAFVRPGDRVEKGERIALAGSRGAPDGCHLHLEVRPADGGVADAVSPMHIAQLTP